MGGTAQISVLIVLQAQKSPLVTPPQLLLLDKTRDRVIQQLVYRTPSLSKYKQEVQDLPISFIQLYIKLVQRKKITPLHIIHYTEEKNYLLKRFSFIPYHRIITYKVYTQLQL